MDKYIKLIETIEEEKEQLLKLKAAADGGKGAAVKAFDKGVGRLWALLFPELPFFKNKMAAWEYLKDAGYKVGRQKVYEAAKSGDLKVQGDGRVFKADVDGYILAAQLMRVADKEIKSLDESSRTETDKRITNWELKNQKLEKEVGILQETWVDKKKRDQLDVEKIQELRAVALAWETRWPPLLAGLSEQEMAEVLRKEVLQMLKNFARDGKFTFLDKIIRPCRHGECRGNGDCGKKSPKELNNG